MCFHSKHKQDSKGNYKRDCGTGCNPEWNLRLVPQGSVSDLENWDSPPSSKNPALGFEFRGSPRKGRSSLIRNGAGLRGTLAGERFYESGL